MRDEARSEAERGGGGDAREATSQADPLVCRCLCVLESEVTQAIRSGADSVEAVGQYCEAGTGCTSCHEPIRVLLQQQARLELSRSRAPKALRQLSLFDELVDDRGGRRKVAPKGGHRHEHE